MAHEHTRHISIADRGRHGAQFACGCPGSGQGQGVCRTAAQPTSYKIIFPKTYPYGKEVKNLTDKIAKYIKDTNAVALKSSEDIYTLTDNFIVIHGFDNKDAAISVLSVLQLHKNYKLTDKVYIISTEDYKIVQMKKKLEEWILLNK